MILHQFLILFDLNLNIDLAERPTREFCKESSNQNDRVVAERMVAETSKMSKLKKLWNAEKKKRSLKPKTKQSWMWKELQILFLELCKREDFFWKCESNLKSLSNSIFKTKTQLRIFLIQFWFWLKIFFFFERKT